MITLPRKSEAETCRELARTVSHVWTTPAVDAWLASGNWGLARAAYDDACAAASCFGETAEGIAARAIYSANHLYLLNELRRSVFGAEDVDRVRGLVGHALSA